MTDTDFCSVRYCRKPADMYLEGRPMCYDHYCKLIETEKKDFEEAREG